MAPQHRVCIVRQESRQAGLTLLEVMIAISIFALIGVASFQVLTSVINTQQVGDLHSDQLASFQKALTVIDRDLQQTIDRPVRQGADKELASLLLRTGDYPIEFTRGGWQNPLMLSRSSLQRVAYDIGVHPLAAIPDSPFFGDDRQYLRRLYWLALDRGDDAEPLVQALLPDIIELQIAVLSEKGRYIQWPITDKSVIPKALEFSFVSPELGTISRLYKIEQPSQ